MPITELLERNASDFGSDVALVEVNPEIKEKRRITWKEYELIETDPISHYRREITWKVFDEKANRFANLLLQRGVKKGDKVGILLMNCLEWLPIYFGILKTGALAVPLNFRYTSDEIKYCLDLAEVDILMFGPEFIGRVPLIVTLDALDSKMLKEILTMPKNALIKQYQKLLSYDGVELEFDNGAIEAVTEIAIARKTGARGLRAILEDAMMDIMYEIPSSEGLQKCIITEDTIKNGEKPIFVYSKKAEKKKTTKKNTKNKTASDADSIPLIAAGAEAIDIGE